MKDMERLFTPKDILDRVSDLEIASLRHLNTRREMGIISSSKASEKRGQKNLYDLKTALIYCILTELESKEFTIEQAAYFAKILILQEFAFRKNIWLVLLYGSYNKELNESYLGFYKNSYKSKDIIYSNVKEKNITIINPLPEIFFYFYEDEINMYKYCLQEIIGIKTLEIGDILQKYIDRFKVDDDELGILFHNAMMNYNNSQILN